MKTRARVLLARAKGRMWKAAVSLVKGHMSPKAYAKLKRHSFEGTLCKPKPKVGSYKAHASYSIVTAVYNVAPYLDEFFESLVAQTMGLSALQIVVVDDGSTDDSADVVESWQRHYPGLIECHRKENGGQASARNIGLRFAIGEWVTFIDPDDFLSPRYFEEVDRAISRHPHLQLVSCRLVFFHEAASSSFSDTHLLTSRFKKDESLYNVDDNWMPIQLSMATAFFRREAIEAASLQSNESIVPDFEDAHFVARYLLSLPAGRVAYLRSPVYYYRKREVGGSTVDKSWNDPRKFTVLPERGYLSLLEAARETRGYVPVWAQNTVLYHISRYFNRFDGAEGLARPFVVGGAAEKFWEFAEQIFTLIDVQTIRDAPDEWLPFARKAALLAIFKGCDIGRLEFSLERIDFERGFMLVKSSKPRLALSYDGRPVEPLLQKERCAFTLGRHFYSEWLFAYPLPDRDATLSYNAGPSVPATLIFGESRFPHSAPFSELARLYKTGWKKYEQRGGLWLFMDRDTQADDNAEHLYRWVAQHHPEREIAFALRRESPDWDRLAAEGFKLLDFGSAEHERELRRCSAIVSSHADNYVHSYFKDNFCGSKKYVFLQHGVILHDMSNWLNQDKPIDAMLTSSHAEFDSIAGDKSPYLLTSMQVVLTGLPRHDALLKKSASCEGDSILVMPTWRKALCGKCEGRGNTRELDVSFAGSLYKNAWEAFLADPRLRELAEATGKKIVFFPHANMFPYVEAGMFKVPDYVEVAGNQVGDSIQDAFARTALFVTDYSSTAFEAAYIERPCLYYQFDREVYQSGQSYAPGYFDFTRDGFGPVVETLDDVIAAIEEIAGKGFAPAHEYLERAHETFAYQDGKCCKRTYEAIEALFEPLGGNPNSEKPGGGALRKGLSA